MKALKWFGAGMAGGLIGAVAWTLITFYTHYEIGFVAWGVGALAGIGVRIAAQDDAGDGPGFVAIAAAVLALCVGKIGVVYLDNRAGNPDYQRVVREIMVTLVADQVILDHRHDGDFIEWVENADPNKPVRRLDYPRAIWIEAEKRFAAFDDSQVRRYRSDPSLLIPEEYVVTFVADRVLRDWASDGRDFDWPRGANKDDPTWSGDYPEVAWDEALARWDSYSEMDQLELRHAIVTIPEGVGLVGAIKLLPWTITPMDLLWFGLAFFTAYKLGADKDD